jgi:hypothetical protein
MSEVASRKHQERIQLSLHHLNQTNAPLMYSRNLTRDIDKDNCFEA